MKNALLCLITILFATHGISQVGINTTTPNAQLDITATNQATPANTDGLLIPKVDQFPVINPSVKQDAMLVYLTTTDGTDAPGFYYWHNATTTWINIPGDKVKKIDNLEDGKSDSTGSSVFLGIEAGAQDNGTNNQNTGIGFQSLQKITSGIRNVGIGYHTLKNNTASYNVAVGYNALLNNTTGVDNVAIGSGALSTNTSGKNNVAIGKNSLKNSSQSGNTAIGNRALELNSTGVSNNAIGTSTLGKNLTGSYNNAMGNGALSNNTTGSLNAAYGNTSLSKNTSGSRNTAFGARTLADNETGINNVAVGIEALFKSKIVSDNVAVGNEALKANLTGSNNVAIGTKALRDNQGTNNVAIGFKSAMTSNNSNTVTLGNSSHNNYIMYTASWTQASDRSLKHSIKQIPVGLDFVNQLNPVEYVYNNAAKKTNKTFGFIAQEIDELVKKSDIKGDVIVSEIGDGMLGLKQVELIPVLTKAIQEQQTHIDNLEQKLDMLNKKLEQLLTEK